MDKLKSFVLKSCTYTVLILALCYTFSGASNTSGVGIPWHRFLIVLGYGLLISASEMIYKITSLHKLLRLGVQYAVLLSGFMVVFVLNGNANGANPMKIFVAVMIFTLIYGIGWGIVLAVKRIMAKADKGGKKSPVKPEKPGKPKYKSLYSDGDSDDKV